MHYNTLYTIHYSVRDGLIAQYTVWKYPSLYNGFNTLVMCDCWCVHILYSMSFAWQKEDK